MHPQVPRISTERTGLIAVVAALVLVVGVCSSGLASLGRSHQAMPMRAEHGAHGAASAAMAQWAAQPDAADDCTQVPCCQWTADKRQRRDGLQVTHAVLAPVADELSATCGGRVPFSTRDAREKRARVGASSPLRL